MRGLLAGWEGGLGTLAWYRVGSLAGRLSALFLLVGPLAACPSFRAGGGADHPYFVAVQFHPEFLSRPLRPSPPFLGFVLAACGTLQQFLADPEHKWIAPENVLPKVRLTGGAERG